MNRFRSYFEKVNDLILAKCCKHFVSIESLLCASTDSLRVTKRFVAQFLKTNHEHWPRTYVLKTLSYDNVFTFNSSYFYPNDEQLSSPEKAITMSKEIKKVFLYGEFQTAVPSFTKELWGAVNAQLKDVKGLIRKTWLYGIGTNTVGGFYEFDSISNAREFATGLYAEQAKYVNASLTVKIFDGDTTEEASRDMKSPYYN